MKILTLGINYAPEIISTAVYTTGLAEQLTAAGDEVIVVTALPYYPAWRVFEDWRGLRYRSETPRAGLRVTHCPLYVPSTPTGAKRLLHHASFALTATPVALWKAVTQKPDLVFVVAPSMVSAPLGWLAAKLAGAKSWLHIQDYEVEAAFATGLLREDSRIGRLAKAFEAWVLRRFDRLSSISRPMVAKLVAKGVPAQKCYELRNWADLSRVSVLTDPSPMRDELAITTPYVALYSGNLANKQGLEILPELARKLAHRTDLTFAICGDGPMRAKLIEAAQGLPNIRFFPLQPVEKLSDLVGMADIHLLPQIKDAADLVLPSKLTNMLASGRPVVATADPGTALAAEVESAGLVVAPGDADAASAAIERLLIDSDLRAQLGAEARRRAEERWDMSAILARLQYEFSLVTHSELNTTRKT
ncbi:WcaI family glycosyltransferase [Paenirhodobacter sp. CAU 1674]|uniref:WcaI family glycosyltransferase n=1 Tax=Paenirhodobacter sp. CAU 1674 TaxID=3032596 RepID=UPI0023DB89C0|nr:WcaI family glycosyltransferase [Paenirhodobacter sp. CAU 1674]MDF2142045.1 WcaI family glycosyltransferase [Paenirhodobacter sp. CAU 1674]